jgi:hypothetical protein
MQSDSRTLDYARSPRPTRWAAYATYCLPALWCGVGILAWMTSAHPDKDLPVVAVFGIAPVCALAIVQWKIGGGMRFLVPLARGLSLGVILLWSLMMGLLIVLHVQDGAFPTDALPLMATLLVSIAIAAFSGKALGQSPT